MSNELDFLVDDANSTDQSTVHVAGVSYPVIQWYGGERKVGMDGNVRCHGGWFVPASKLDLSGALPPGWKPSFIYVDGPKDGELIEQPGFYATSLDIAFINERHQYTVGRGKDAKIFPANQYDAANKHAEEMTKIVGKPMFPRKKSQFFVVVKGIESPVVLTLSGAFAKAMSGQTGLLQRFNRDVMGYVNAQLKSAGTNNLLPRRRFWITVGLSLNAEGKPEFEKFGEGKDAVYKVKPAIYGIPSALSMDYIKSIHTGAANKDRFDQLYTESLDWSKAWDAIKAGATEEKAEAQAAVVTDPETAAALKDL